jgi:hypothetical protein
MLRIVGIKRIDLGTERSNLSEEFVDGFWHVSVPRICG